MDTEKEKQQTQSSEQQFDIELHQAVIKLLTDFEKENKLKVIFAAETGSRGQGFHTEQSDCDIKGFYTYSEEQYLRVTDLQESFLGDKLSVNVQGKLIEVDFSFLEFRYYIELRLNKEHEKANIIFTSGVQYINLFEKEAFNQFVYQTLRTPQKAFYSDLETFITRRIQKQDVECRKILNTLHCLLSVIHFSQSNKLQQYSYNLWEEIELNPYVDASTKNNILQFAKLCLEKKNFSRKATIKRSSLPVWFTDLLDLYNSQRDGSITIEEEPLFLQLAQQLHLFAMKLI